MLGIAESSRDKEVIKDKMIVPRKATVFQKQANKTDANFGFKSYHDSDGLQPIEPMSKAAAVADFMADGSGGLASRKKVYKQKQQ